LFENLRSNNNFDTKLMKKLTLLANRKYDRVALPAFNDENGLDTRFMVMTLVALCLSFVSVAYTHIARFFDL